MRMRILEFTQQSDTEYRATMQLGDSTTSAKIIVEPIDEEIVGFNFAETSLLSLVLNRCGLDGRFNDDFERFRQGERITFPVEYGDVGEDRINEAMSFLEQLADQTASEEAVERCDEPKSR